MEEKNVFCPNCGTNLGDGSYGCCHNCGTIIANEPAQTTMLNSEPYSAGAAQAQAIPVTEPAKAKKSKGKKPIIIVCAILAVLLIGVAIAAVFILKLSSTPLAALGKGYEKLVTSGKTYEVSLEAAEYDGKSIDEGIKGSASVKFDLSNRLIAFDDVKGTYYWDGEPDEKLSDYFSDINGIIDAKNNTIGGVVKVEDEDVTYYLCDGIFSIIAEDDEAHARFLNDEQYKKAMAIISDTLGLACGEKIDTDAYAKKVVDLANEFLADDEKIELDSSKISQEKIDKLKADLLKYFTDEKWLTEYFGYAKEKQDGAVVYSFNVDAKSLKELKHVFKDDIIDILQDVFKNMKDEFESYIGIDDFGEIKDDLLEEYDYFVDDFDDNDTSLNFSFSTTKGVLTAIDVAYDDGYDDLKLKLTFEETQDISISKDDYGKYYSEGVKETKDQPIFSEIIKENEKAKACKSNIMAIRSNAANYYATYNKVGTIADIAKMFDDGKIPTCPYGGEYKIVIGGFGSTQVYCQSKDCPNHEEYQEMPTMPYNENVPYDDVWDEDVDPDDYYYEDEDVDLPYDY